MYLQEVSTHPTSFCNIHFRHETLQGKQSLLMATAEKTIYQLQPTCSQVCLFSQPSCQGTLALLKTTSSPSPMMTRDSLCWSHGSRTYHDNQPELIHERWPNQSIETRDWVAHGETWQFWRVVRWSSGWEDNSRNFTGAYTVQICFGSKH